MIDRINELDYRLRVIEKFLDSNGLIKTYKGERSDIDSIKIEVLHEMREEIQDFKIKAEDLGIDFYRKKRLGKKQQDFE